VREAESRFRGVRGLSVFWRLWLPGDGPTASRARVVVAHGYGEHGGRYRHAGERLTAAGYEVVIPDHRGHGRSEGRPVSVISFDDYLDDLHRLTSLVAAERGPAQTFLLGHSMGGLIAAAYALRHPAELRGLVLSAPAVLPGHVSATTVAFGRLLARLAPNLGTVSLPVDQISRDPAVVAAYFADPLVHRHRLRARLGTEMLRVMREVATGLPALRLPVLVMQGTADRLVPPQAAEFVAQRLGGSDTTVNRYPGLYHEIFNEPEREAVLDDLVAWLGDRAPPR
jgi:alpha-beta hydrolase superfamily lysophospholipase